ncbi:MAG: hypothetical protein LQ338_001368 [Usnochroma carphineum]|nr:MAG: hypothetical protein LQ338_001368 [Usnochroma carphineum]
MPALGSSIINKSGKKFAPKAPARRPATATPTQTTSRASVDRAESSETPQLETSPPAANLQDRAPSQAPTTDLSITTVEPETPHDNASHTPGRPRDEDTVQNVATNTRPLDRYIDVSSYQSLEQSPPTVEGTDARSIDPIPEILQTVQPAKSSNHGPLSTISTVNTTAQNKASSRSPLQPSVNRISQTERLEIAHHDAPPAKRRKLVPDRVTKPSAAQITKPSAPQRRPNVQVQVPPRSGKASSEGTPRADAERTGRAGEQPAQPPRPTKKTSAKGNGKRHQAAAGAEVGVDTARDPTRRVRDTRKTTRVRKSHQKTSVANKRRLQDAAAEIVADAVEGSTSRRKGRRGRKARELTPEEAENETIAPGTIKMADLCKDTGKGKKSDTLRALQERDREELAKEKQKELQQLVEGEEQPDPVASAELAPSEAVNSDSRRPEGVIERQEDVVREVADTYVDEHGQIRINTDSLRIDRHAQAAAAREQNQEEAVVENDFSKPAVNSGTYLKRERQSSWPESLTDEFYEALRTFGTDFGMISRMLRKTRRAVKLKFNREEKVASDRIDEALRGARIAIDLDEYSRRAGEDIKEMEEHERKMEEDRKKIEEDAADELRAKEEQEQVRRDQAEKETAAVPDDSSGKENRDAGRKKKKKERKERKERKTGEKRKRRQKKGVVAEEASEIA